MDSTKHESRKTWEFFQRLMTLQLACKKRISKESGLAASVALNIAQFNGVIKFDSDESMMAAAYLLATLLDDKESIEKFSSWLEQDDTNFDDEDSDNEN